jgi:hypothetical protein
MQEKTVPPLGQHLKMLFSRDFEMDWGNNTARQ